jgi:hypothetical protein
MNETETPWWKHNSNSIPGWYYPLALVAILYSLTALPLGVVLLADGQYFMSFAVGSVFVLLQALVIISYAVLDIIIEVNSE